MYSDAYEMHGYCQPTVAAACSKLEPAVAGKLGDGYRGLGNRLGEDKTTKLAKDAAVSRNYGTCSTLCSHVPQCTYWIVHDQKGAHLGVAWL